MTKYLLKNGETLDSLQEVLDKVKGSPFVIFGKVRNTFLDKVVFDHGDCKAPITTTVSDPLIYTAKQVIIEVSDDIEDTELDAYGIVRHAIL